MCDFVRFVPEMNSGRRRRFWPIGPAEPQTSPGGASALFQTSSRFFVWKAHFTRKAEGLYDKMDGVGAHEVIIETPEHFQTLASAPEKRVEDLFWAYRDRVLDLRQGRSSAVLTALQEPRRSRRRRSGAHAFATDCPPGRSQASPGRTRRRTKAFRIQGTMRVLRHPGAGGRVSATCGS